MSQVQSVCSGTAESRHSNSEDNLLRFNDQEGQAVPVTTERLAKLMPSNAPVVRLDTEIPGKLKTVQRDEVTAVIADSAELFSGRFGVVNQAARLQRPLNLDDRITLG